MPDYERLKQALEAKAKLPMECPVCRKDEWGTSAITVGLLPFDDVPPPDEAAGREEDEVEFQGYWPLACRNCGYVRLFQVDFLLGH